MNDFIYELSLENFQFNYDNMVAEEFFVQSTLNLKIMKIQKMINPLLIRILSKKSYLLLHNFGSALKGAATIQYIFCNYITNIVSNNVNYVKKYVKEVGIENYIDTSI